MERDHVHDETEILRTRLRAAQETLETLRRDVDAIVIEGPAGPKVYTVTNAHQPYRMIVEEMQQGAVVLTPAGDIFYGNRYFADMVRVPPDRLVGMPMVEFVEISDQPGFEGLISQGAGTLETVLRASDGTGVPVYITVNLFSESPANVCLTVTNLTEQKRQATREAALAREEAARAAAEAASRAKDQFLAMLSHELRSPLSVILTGVEVLERLELPDNGPLRIRELIGRQARHLAQLLDDLLDVTRVSQGKIDLHRSPVDLGGIVSSVVEDHRGEIEGAGHSLRLSLPSRAVAVDGDRTRLLQVIGNLLHNARKYTARGGDISVSLEQVGLTAQVRVRDTGVGIPSEMLPRIFDLFFQGEPTAPRSGAGLGVGLTLVRRLVELHGGTVEAVSDGPGRGSEFIVRFPVTQSPLVDEPKEALGVRPTALLRILLIEDHDDTREMVGRGLQLLGQTIALASDGETGLRMALADPPDAAVIDIGLPGADGYEIARRLRAAFGERLRLVALTGYGQADDRRLVQEAGFDAHLVKPVAPKDVLRAVVGT
ncbi:MAG: hybrid sensor histidine kinase/response regulator [Candidatus Rokuibacteriota bacterium]|nr:MAG: hybrid sensor histidine kinase/response regulator [Candidatus Rokubacteria bacterium]